MEAVGIVSAIASVITGYYQAVIAILLAVGVMLLVSSGARRLAAVA